MNRFEKITSKCPVNLNLYKTLETGARCIKCMVETHHENRGYSKNWFFVVWSQNFLSSLISRVSRDFQHLLFADCSLNGKGLFTGIDGSWKLKNAMVLGYDSMEIFVSIIHLQFTKRLAD